MNEARAMDGADARSVERREPGRLDTAALGAWLWEEAVAPEGTVCSWRNPLHPGYTYPEAAGLCLTLAAEPDLLDLPGGGFTARRDRMALALSRAVSASGGVGRDGALYTFDTAIALHGLLSHERAGGALPDPRVVDRMFDFVESGIRARRAVANAEATPRWSSSWSCHQLKLAVALAAYGGQRGHEERVHALAGALADELVPLGRGGRFVSDTVEGGTYLHAHCYAVEGLLGLGDLGMEVSPLLLECLDWQASVQASDGSFPSWHDGLRGWGPHRSDVAAQAARLWAAVDPRRYAAEIRRSLRWLAALQAPRGGIRYEPGSADVNTWCTVFTAQAARWAARGRRGEWLA